MVADSDSQQNVVFSIQKIYIKDISYETSDVPEIFTQQGGAPQVNVQFAIKNSVLDEENGLYEVEMTVTVKATMADKTVFLVEVKQAGIFRIKGIDSDQLPILLQMKCPDVLLPFAREVINDLVTKGGFPQLMLAPVNFEALYEQNHNTQPSEVQTQ